MCVLINTIGNLIHYYLSRHDNLQIWVPMSFNGLVDVYLVHLHKNGFLFAPTNPEPMPNTQLAKNLTLRKWPRKTKVPSYYTKSSYSGFLYAAERTSILITNTRVVYILQRIPYPLPTLSTNVRIQPRGPKSFHGIPEGIEKRSNSATPRKHLKSSQSDIMGVKGVSYSSQGLGVGFGFGSRAPN